VVRTKDSQASGDLLDECKHKTYKNVLIRTYIYFQYMWPIDRSLMQHDLRRSSCKQVRLTFDLFVIIVNKKLHFRNKQIFHTCPAIYVSEWRGGYIVKKNTITGLLIVAL